MFSIYTIIERNKCNLHAVQLPGKCTQKETSKRYKKQLLSRQKIGKMSALTLPLDCAAAPKSGQLCSFENYLCVTLCKNVLPNSKLLDILLSLQQIKQPSLHEGARIASMSLANHWHAAYRKYSSMMSSTKNGQCIATNAPVHLNEKTYSLFCPILFHRNLISLL